MENMTISLEEAKAFDYMDFFNLVEELVAQDKTTGEAPTPERIDFTKLNLKRMKRVEKQYNPSEEMEDVLKLVNRKMEWVVLAEAWCGDGAQVLPVIACIAAKAPQIDLKVILRDENPEIMDRYLTNGGRAIPKLIAFDKLTGEELGTWGPRPKRIQQMVLDFKAQNPDASHDDLMKNLHLWYAKDKGQAVQEDLYELILQWNS